MLARTLLLQIQYKLLGWTDSVPWMDLVHIWALTISNEQILKTITNPC